MAVARSGSIFFNPAFAKIAVKAAKRADSSANNTQGELVNMLKIYAHKVKVNPKPDQRKGRLLFLPLPSRISTDRIPSSIFKNLEDCDKNEEP